MDNCNGEALSRAQGCLVGLVAGDVIGSIAEFKQEEEAEALFLGKLKDLTGQPTDDTEMALALARTLVQKGYYDREYVKAAYVKWLNSDPIDCGMTIASALRGHFIPESQANGALMRVAPLGIFGAKFQLDLVASWAREDASITHPNPVCLEANELFAMALAFTVRTGPSASALYEQISRWAKERLKEPLLLEVVSKGAQEPPKDYYTHQGWVLIALHNALWQLVHAESLEEGVVNTAKKGGDADTNAAVCGALLGAVYGIQGVPSDWVKSILDMRLEVGRKGIIKPRPLEYWPVDILELAQKLIEGDL